MYIKGSKARNFIKQYYIAPCRNIYHCYVRPSQNKIAAWGYCVTKCREMEGFNMKVLSFNSSYFTAAWCYTHPDTGVLMLHVETYANSYDMEM